MQEHVAHGAGFGFWEVFAGARLPGVYVDVVETGGGVALQVAAASNFGGRGQQGGGQLFVEGEEELDAFAVGGEGFGPVAALDGAVERWWALTSSGGMRTGS